MTPRLKLLSVLLLCCLLLVLPGTCSAYTITTEELTRLETIFNQLESNNNEQGKKLERASELLQKSEKQIQLLNEKLTIAEQSINQAQNSLEKVNKSFSEYERESKKEKNRLTWQRNLFAGIALYAIFSRN